MPLTYPKTKQIDQVDDYHGVLVRDPYRWLEDTDAPDTRAWIEAQNELTFRFLEQIPERESIRSRLTELWDHPKMWAPLQKGGRYFQLRNTGLQNQNVLWVMDGPDEEGRVLLDPNGLSEDGTVALVNWSVSEDGRWLAYATSASGSDWLTWRVRDVDTGEDLPDVIQWSKFSAATWLPDGSGFLYARYAAPAPGEAYQGVNENQQLCLHRLHTGQDADVVLYARPDHPKWGFAPAISDDDRYVVLHVWRGTDRRNRLFYAELEPFLAGAAEPTPLIGELEASYTFLGNDGPVFYLLTDHDAPRKRIVAVDIRQPERSRWRTLVPEREDAIETARMVHDEFICVTMHHARHRLLRYSVEGAPLGEIELPTLGSILTMPAGWGFNGRREDDELFYAFHSFAWPLSVYRYDLAENRNQLLFSPEIDFDFQGYTTEQYFAVSPDGTRAPYFLVQAVDAGQKQPQPTLLYAYGGFDIAILPSFVVGRLVWLEMGGALAVANLRGGGEYGETWHRAGMLENKQRVFDDFIAVAEDLIERGVTTSPQLAIEGRSNGGLLVGACMTQRPELYGAALPGVGVMDMLRFHKFTIGWAWVSEYGSADDPEQFQILYAYSPLHNIRPGVCYPPTLITTGDHDDRVVPGHSFKFAAALQAAQGCDNPVLIRIQTKTGHGFGKPTALLIDEQTDIYAFLAATVCKK